MSLLLLFTGTPTTQSVPLDDPDLFWSPGNWLGNGVGAMQANNLPAGSTEAATGNTGAYHFGKMSVVSTGFLAVLFDTSQLTGLTAADCPTLQYSVDGGPWTAELLVASGSPQTVVLGAALGAGEHTWEIYCKSVGVSGLGATANRFDLGATPAFVWRVVDIQIDADAALVAPTIRPNRALVFADSGLEGDNVLLAYNDSANDIKNPSNDASQTLGEYLRPAFNCEICRQNYGGIGFSIKGIGNDATPDATRPSLWNATDANQCWNKIATGEARDFTTTPYDYVFLAIGANDATSFSQADATAGLNEMLAVITTAEFFWIWYPTDVDAVVRTRIIAAIAACDEPTRVHFIDIELLFEAGVGSQFSSDSVFGGGHPNLRGEAWWTALALPQIQAVLSSGSGGGIRLAGYGGLAA